MSILFLRGIVYDYDISQHMDWVILLRFVVFSLLCFKCISDIYLSMMESNSLCKFNNMLIYKITEDIQ